MLILVFGTGLLRAFNRRNRPGRVEIAQVNGVQDLAAGPAGNLGELVKQDAYAVATILRLPPRCNSGGRCRKPPA